MPDLFYSHTKLHSELQRGDHVKTQNWTGNDNNIFVQLRNWNSTRNFKISHEKVQGGLWVAVHANVCVLHVCVLRLQMCICMQYAYVLCVCVFVRFCMVVYVWMCVNKKDSTFPANVSSLQMNCCFTNIFGILCLHARTQTMQTGGSRRTSLNVAQNDRGWNSLSYDVLGAPSTMFLSFWFVVVVVVSGAILSSSVLNTIRCFFSFLKTLAHAHTQTWLMMMMMMIVLTVFCR